MQIRFTTTIHGSKGNFLRGHDYELPADDAAEYLAKGLAVVADAEAPAPSDLLPGGRPSAEVPPV